MAFNAFFTEMILPFLLIFVVVFAVLQKSKIFGENKKQIDSMVALVIGLLAIGLPSTRDFIVSFMPWLGVGLAVLLVFFILYGFVHGDLSNMPKGLKVTFGILAGIFTLGVLIYVTGFWNTLERWFGGNSLQDGFWLTAFLVVLVIGGMLWIVLGGKSGGSSGSS